MKTTAWFGILLCALGLLGCAAEADDEILSEARQAIFQAGCGTAEADYQIDATVHPQWTYIGPSENRPGCIGSRILNVVSYQEGADVKVDGATVAWADPLPDNQQDCERLWLGASVYRKSGSSYVHVKDNEARGVWVDYPPCTGPGLCLDLDHCEGPAVTYVSSVSDGRSYRFVGSARRLSVANGAPSGAHELRNVQFNSRIIQDEPR